MAGLVGIGLSRLFAASGLEDVAVGRDADCANSMGLFLQKTNIIRDYHEDLVEGRTWWPEEVGRGLGWGLVWADGLGLKVAARLWELSS